MYTGYIESKFVW